LHVAWAAWCAVAIGTATRHRWRHLAWLYPAATTLVVLASANHFLLDAVGGIAVTGLGMLAAGRRLPITFPRVLPRRHRQVQPRLAGELWMAVSGLSAAATVGLYALARHSAGASTSARGPAPATPGGQGR
ncbi:MAG TPA: phosphatase PAP2 family protein, partial [Streptosporangiaceae bacterium]